jgi:hypothetical protein
MIEEKIASDTEAIFVFLANCLQKNTLPVNTLIQFFSGFVQSINKVTTLAVDDPRAESSAILTNHERLYTFCAKLETVEHGVAETELNFVHKAFDLALTPPSRLDARDVGAVGVNFEHFFDSGLNIDQTLIFNDGLISAPTTVGCLQLVSDFLNIHNVSIGLEVET